MITRKQVYKLDANFDIFLFISLIFSFILLQLNITFLNNLDEILCIYFLFRISLVLGRVRRNKFLFTIVVFYFVYSIFLTIFRELPFTSYLQIFISSKFIIFFYYFYLKNQEYKDLFLQKILFVLKWIFYISLVFCVLQFFFPLLFKTDYRGLNGIVLQGVFFSRTIFSSFLVLLLILVLYNQKPIVSFFKIENKVKLSALIVILLFLTFTRKDLIFGLLIFLIYINFKRVRYRFLLRLASILMIVVIPYANNFFYKDINEKTFTEDQIRFEIIDSGLDVFSKYAPFGSGPGTFGSIMSMQYQKVYLENNIPTRIYLGYEHSEYSRGPIFDVFIVSLIAEYGLFFFVFYLIAFLITKIKSSNQFFDFKRIRMTLFIYICYLSFTVPIFNNFNGLIIFTLLGVITGSNKTLKTT